jgi:CBS domain-containing protein
VTDRDITVRATARGADPINTSVPEVCSREIVVVESDQTVDEAIALMRERSLRRLPVVENAGQSIVSLGDLGAAARPGIVLEEVSAAAPNE